MRVREIMIQDSEESQVGYRVGLAGNRRTDGRRGGGESDSSLNCGNDSVMHSASGGNGKRERREGGAQFCRLLRAERLAGCVAPALNLEHKLAYFTPR